MKNPLEVQVYYERREQKNFGIRGDYFRDQTAIIHSMPFRRLKNKTQVFFAPNNDHVCTRIEHVMHVASIASTICRGLNKANPEWELDPELAYTIGLGHDLGHAPFGHAGETALNNKLRGKATFIHEVNSYRVVEYLANNGKGLNLTYGVKDGIICHNGENFEQSLKPNQEKNNLDKISDRKCVPTTYEGCIVRLSDKIAYLGRDIEDAIIAGFIKWDSIPLIVSKQLGNSNGEIINTLVEDVIKYTKDKSEVGFSKEKHEIMVALRDFNYKYIYGHAKIMEYKKMGEKIIKSLFDYLLDLYDSYGNDYEKYEISNILIDRQFGRYINKMEEFYRTNGNAPYKIVTDYVSGMTDLFALDCMKQITIPQPLKFGE